MKFRKNMKTGLKYNIIITFLMLIVNVGGAQHLYIGGNMGMGFQAFPTKVETFFNVNNDNNTVRLQQPAFSLGAGFIMEASIGYFFNDYIGIDMGFQYQIGSKVSFSQEYVILTQTEHKESNIYAKRFSFIPSLIMKVGDGKVQPFFKVGPMFGSISQRLEEITTLDTNVAVKNWKYEGPMAIGLSVEFGAQYNISEHMGVYLSSTFSNMVYTPTQAEAVFATKNGMRVDESLQPFERTLLFVDWSDDPYNAGPQDPMKPTRLQSQSFTYSNITLELGMQYLF